jgi:dolichol kinase
MKLPDTYRKSIHLSSLIIPISYHFLTYLQMLTLMLLSTICIIAWDTNRNKKNWLGAKINTLNKVFKLDTVLKKHEKSGKITGATYMMISGLICLMLFPKEVFIIAFTVLVISDACANLYGKKYGKPNKITGKSLIGSKAFAMSSFIISIVLGKSYGLELAPLMLASLTAAYFEHCSNLLKIDDNFIVPISYSFSYLIFAALL